jgi:hypothetical protein
VIARLRLALEADAAPLGRGVGQHVDQEEVGQQMGDLRRVDIAPRRHQAVAAQALPQIIKLLKLGPAVVDRGEATVAAGNDGLLNNHQRTAPQ